MGAYLICWFWNHLRDSSNYLVTCCDELWSLTWRFPDNYASRQFRACNLDVTSMLSSLLSNACWNVWPSYLVSGHHACLFINIHMWVLPVLSGRLRLVTLSQRARDRIWWSFRCSHVYLVTWHATCKDNLGVAPTFSSITRLSSLSIPRTRRFSCPWKYPHTSEEIWMHCVFYRALFI